MTETIDMGMTWEVAARLYCIVLRDGTPRGQYEAEQELVRMGQMLDAFADAARAGTAEAYAEAVRIIQTLQQAA